MLLGATSVALAIRAGVCPPSHADTALSVGGIAERLAFINGLTPMVAAYGNGPLNTVAAEVLLYLGYPLLVLLRRRQGGWPWVFAGSVMLQGAAIGCRSERADLSPVLGLRSCRGRMVCNERTASLSQRSLGGNRCIYHVPGIVPDPAFPWQPLREDGDAGALDGASAHSHDALGSAQV